MMDEEHIRERVRGWISNNRQGSEKDLPCYWTLYAINSINSTPPKNGGINCSNLHIEDLEESVAHLMDSMSNTTHVKYFAIRLRSKKGDQGVINNFHNPYYSAPSRSSISGIPSNSANDLSAVMIGLLKDQSEDRLRQAEERNLLMQQLLINQKESEARFLTYKKDAEIAKLKEENEALRNAPSTSPIVEFLQGIKPEVTELLKHKISGHIPYPDAIEGANEESGEAMGDLDNKEMLDQSLNLLKRNVSNPEGWIFKLAFVLDNLEEQQAKTLLNTLHHQYQSFKKENQGGSNEQ